MQSEKLIGLIQSATSDVFTTMLGLEVQAGEAKANHTIASPSEGVVALVGLAGAWSGVGALECTPSAARKLAGSFLMQEFASMDEDVLDAMAELANMILGGVKSALEEDLGPMGLSIPTVVYGRNFETHGGSGKSWIVVPFYWAGEHLEVRLCLVPSRRSTREVPPGASVSMLT